MNQGPGRLTVPVPGTAAVLELIPCEPECCDTSFWLMDCPACGAPVDLPGWADDVPGQRQGCTAGAPDADQLTEAAAALARHQCKTAA